MISYGANFSPFTVTDFFLLVPETNPKNPPVADPPVLTLPDKE